MKRYKKLRRRSDINHRGSKLRRFSMNPYKINGLGDKLKTGQIDEK